MEQVGKVYKIPESVGDQKIMPYKQLKASLDEYNFELFLGGNEDLNEIFDHEIVKYVGYLDHRARCIYTKNSPRLEEFLDNYEF